MTSEQLSDECLRKFVANDLPNDEWRRVLKVLQEGSDRQRQRMMALAEEYLGGYLGPLPESVYRKVGGEIEEKYREEYGIEISNLFSK